MHSIIFKEPPSYLTVPFIENRLFKVFEQTYSSIEISIKIDQGLN